MWLAATALCWPVVIYAACSQECQISPTNTKAGAFKGRINWRVYEQNEKRVAKALSPLCGMHGWQTRQGICKATKKKKKKKSRSTIWIKMNSISDSAVSAFWKMSVCGKTGACKACFLAPTNTAVIWSIEIKVAIKGVLSNKCLQL